MIIKETTDKDSGKKYLRSVAQSRCFRADISDICHDIRAYLSDYAIRAEGRVIGNTNYNCSEEKLQEAFLRAIDIFDQNGDADFNCVIDIQETGTEVINLNACSIEEFLRFNNALVSQRNSNAPRYIMLSRSAAGNNMIMEVAPIDICAHDTDYARERAYRRVISELRARS